MTKFKSQLRAEAVERLRTMPPTQVTNSACINALIGPIELRPDLTEGQDIIDVLIDLLTDDEFVNCKDSASLKDSREQLEFDIMACISSDTAEEYMQFIGDVFWWLDRQAAITRAECDKPNWDYCESCEQFKAMQDRIDELEAALKGERNNFYQAMESCKHWQREYETVKAERDELQERVDNLCASEEIGNKLIMAQLETEAEQGRTIVEYAERVGELEAERASWQSGYHNDMLAKLQAQRDRYRDLLSKAVDEAQGIVKLMEVER